MKIKKYTIGGGIPFTPFIPNQTLPEKPKSDTEAANKTQDFFQKELMDIISENGLPSDVDRFTNQVQSMISNSFGLSSTSPFGGSSQYDLASKLMNIKAEANKVRFNNQLWEDAKENLNKEDAWSEAATDDAGHLYVFSRNEGIKLITPKEYYNNQDNYQVITNSQLLKLRESDVNLAYNSNMLSDAVQAIGINTVYNELIKITEKLGTEILQGYSSKDANDIFNGAKYLMQSGPEAYYKVTDERQISDIEKTLYYLYKKLPQGMKKTLKATVAAEGRDPEKQENILEMIALIAGEHTKTSVKVDTEYQPTGKGSRGGSGGSTSTATTESTLPIEVAMGNLTETISYISPVARRASDNTQMAFKSWNAGILQDRQGDGLHSNNLQDLLPVVDQAKGADTSAITFGNQLLSAQEIASVVWDGSSLATRVALPKKFVNGKQCPDFDLLIKYNEINAWIKDNPGVTTMEIQQKLQNLGSDGITYDPKTNSFTISPERVGYFLTFAGYGSRDLMDIQDQSKPFLEKTSNSEGKMIKKWFNNLVQHGKLNPSKKEKPKNDFEDSERRDFYYGNIYMPIVDPLQANILTKKQLYSKDTFMNASKKSELGNQISNSARNSNWKTNF